MTSSSIVLRSAATLALWLGLAVLAHADTQDTWREPVTGMTFVRIPKACFQMGVPGEAFREEDPALQARVRTTEQPSHEVCLDEFWMARHEVTEGEWRAVMAGGADRSDPTHPAVAVTWQDTQEFANRLAKKGTDGTRYRLPSEAEWEYACRAGEPPTTQIPGRDELNGKAWFSSHYDFPFSGTRHKTVQPVEKKAPNRLGLHDMLGNTWEWTQDHYAPDAYAHHALFNPVSSNASDLYVIRGGSIRSSRQMIRCEARAWLKGTTRQDTTGFRLVRVPPGANR